jgi:hypothetical protein
MNCVDVCSRNFSLDLSTVFFDFGIIFIILKTTFIIHNKAIFHFFQFMELNALKCMSYNDELCFSGSIKRIFDQALVSP